MFIDHIFIFTVFLCFGTLVLYLELSRTNFLDPCEFEIQIRCFWAATSVAAVTNFYKSSKASEMCRCSLPEMPSKNVVLKVLQKS